MKVEFEIVHPDEGSSFRLLHEKTLPEKYLWQYHYHPEYELVCVLQGSGTRHVGNHLSNYINGDLVLIGPNLPHAGFGLNAHGLHEEIVIQIKEDILEQFLGKRPEMSALQALLEKTKYGICFAGETKKKVTRLLIKSLKQPPFERLITFMHIVKTLAASSEYVLLNLHTPLSSSLKKHTYRLQKIFKYVDNHFTEEIDIQTVAALVALSVPSFCNYFKKIMNITFTDFLNRHRIQKACILLQHEKTVAEVSFECGFNNVTYFNKVFKTIMLKTPTAFKNSIAQ